MEFQFLIRSIIILFLICSLSACQKEITIPIPKQAISIVIDGKIETGLPPIVFLSYTKDIFSPTNLDSIFGGFIDDAVIIVSNGLISDTLDRVCTDEIPDTLKQYASFLFGVPKSIIEQYHFCFFSTLNPSLFGQIGNRYTIKVMHKNKTYNAITTIEKPVPLDSIYWKPEKKTPDHGYIYANLSEPYAENNFYLWEVLQIKAGNDGMNKDQKFYKPSNPVFNDQFINGLLFTISYENPRSRFDKKIPEEFRGLYKKGDTIMVKFSTLNKDSYRFLEQKYVQLQSGGSPFSTPVNLPSTISNGALGSWIGYSPSYKVVICK